MTRKSRNKSKLSWNNKDSNGITNQIKFTESTQTIWTNVHGS